MKRDISAEVKQILLDHVCQEPGAIFTNSVLSRSRITFNNTNAWTNLHRKWFRMLLIFHMGKNRSLFEQCFRQISFKCNEDMILTSVMIHELISQRKCRRTCAQACIYIGVFLGWMIIIVHMKINHELTFDRWFREVSKGWGLESTWNLYTFLSFSAPILKEKQWNSVEWI